MLASDLQDPPEIINEFLVSEYRRIFDYYKKHNIIINFHSCGHIEELIDTFVDLGVDILNPIQVTANDIIKIREKTQNKICLCGGISSGLIMDSTPDIIRSQVKNIMNILGSKGGYFCSPDQCMPFPEDNIKAFYDAVKEYGKYSY